MPKEKQSLYGRLSSYVAKFGSDTFAATDSCLFCKVCQITINSEKKFNVIQHIRTYKHTKGLKRREYQILEPKQSLIIGLPSRSPFNTDLCEALLAANIPLNKLSNSKFRTFLEKYTGKNIPFENTLRNEYIDDVYYTVIENIKNDIGKNKIWVSIDETCDVDGRIIANVIVGILKTDVAGSKFLVHSEETEKTNHTTICKLFEKAMGIIWPGDILYDNVLLFLTDAAPYMIKASSVLKSLYTKMVHVSCAAHGIHRVAEEIRGQFHTVDDLISSVKKTFRKAPSRVLLFKTEAPGIKLPPEPITTRWGTWLDAAIYYCEHFETIVRIINLLDENDVVSIQKAKLCILEPELQSDLIYIKSNFEVLTVANKQLQEQNVPLADSLKVIESIESKFQNLKGTHGQAVLTKLENVFKKNEGLNTLKKISKIITGDEEPTDLNILAEDITCNDLVYFKYAPITSVHIERSFSPYKTILADNRRTFIFENVRKQLIVQCNYRERLVTSF
ncbi:Ribonuclease H-like domain,Domain of unknown function DUF659 [Cinara cedri]|uniref:DUF659 domain-containing protein n=1 Tax=Cinara cedri TaxID=506608 RepID=A0A5E4MVD6_9HEMI|nr:Ribonuclease H-like domain,Domain of unknown function DUF659 [Cinara cedri]